MQTCLSECGIDTLRYKSPSRTIATLRCKPGEYVVAVLYASCMASEARLMLCFVNRLSIDEAAKPPAAGRCISARVFYHYLHRCRLTGDRRRFEFGGLLALIRKFDQDRPVRIRPRRVLNCLDRSRVAEHDTKLVKRRRLFSRCDHFPLSITLGNRELIDRRCRGFRGFRGFCQSVTRHRAEQKRDAKNAGCSAHSLHLIVLP